MRWRPVDAAALKRTWARVGGLGDQVPLYFYSHLFMSRPELREMFPISMAAQRDRLVGALGRIVSTVDQLDRATEFIKQLGRDHRRFTVIAPHHDAVGTSLLVTLEHFLGDDWTPQVAGDWARAYGIIAKVMVLAAEDAEQDTPAWWDAEVTDVDRRTLEVAVLQVRPTEPYDFAPGQSFAVQIPQRPRLWRHLSAANAPRPDGSLELHAQIVAGGQVSGVLAWRVKPGDVLKLGAPIGDQLVPDPDDARDLLMVAGGTGLAPLRAVLELLDRRWIDTGSGPAVQLFHGARYARNLYEHDWLTALAGRPWFAYTPVVSDGPTYPGARGMVGRIAAHPRWAGRLAMVCGSPEMVKHSTQALRSTGFAATEIRYEQFGTVDEDSHLQHVTGECQ